MVLLYSPSVHPVSETRNIRFLCLFFLTSRIGVTCHNSRFGRYKQKTKLTSVGVSIQRNESLPTQLHLLMPCGTVTFQLRHASLVLKDHPKTVPWKYLRIIELKKTARYEPNHGLITCYTPFVLASNINHSTTNTYPKTRFLLRSTLSNLRYKTPNLTSIANI